MTEASDTELLTTGELAIVGRVTTASNATLVCEIVRPDEAPPLRCVYKPVRGERPLWDFPDGTLAGREVSSFLVSEALGWGVVPTTVLRDGPFGPGMVQRWIDTADHHPERGEGIDMVDLCRPDMVPTGYIPVLQAYDDVGEEVSLVHADDPRLQRMAVLDILVNNADRKGGHVLEGLDGSVYGVDHGICMHTDDKLRTVLWGWAGRAIDDGSMADVVAFAEKLGTGFTDTLAPHITDVEIDALIDRTATLIARPVMPTPDRHRPIPWPAF
ncbi:phosphatidylinositol kinase [Rhodococcoides trifolii]|uniref:Phosphatidylinositol kinase n=1 Tax=Rhodococcoides trifolii TaxID=908250 RepID=A0A917D370_9NOCA|nr:SCO1664 family protein [Rhodococcus trifolii]GGG09986.1 phosphatidylinositol kinase [Rhodococcus trifolii]